MKNSTVEELHAFMEGYNRTPGGARGELDGISKISVQTGTSHGGVVLPDGSIADVKLDLAALEALSRGAEEYGMAGAVQHGASTLPPTRSGTSPGSRPPRSILPPISRTSCSIIPGFPPTCGSASGAGSTRTRRRAESGDTAEQFYYRARKRAIGPFKRDMWCCPRPCGRRLRRISSRRSDFCSSSSA